jgi:hypothetical protein
LVTPGGLENAFDPEDFDKQQKEQSVKARVDTIETRAREAGL